MNGCVVGVAGWEVSVWTYSFFSALDLLCDIGPNNEPLWTSASTSVKEKHCLSDALQRVR